jgi:Glycosyl hydrolases family 16
MSFNRLLVLAPLFILLFAPAARSANLQSCGTSLQPPPQAVAAGFTNMIFDSEPGCTPLAQLVDCPGQPQTAQWHLNLSYAGIYPPCSQVSLVYDWVFGQNVLDLEWTPANTRIGEPGATQLSTFPNGFPPAPHFSYQYGYAEGVMRLAARAPGAAMTFWEWSDPWAIQGETPPYKPTGVVGEYDIVEWYVANGGAIPSEDGVDQCTHYWDASHSTRCAVFTSYAPWDPSQPHTYGLLWSPTQICYYVDNVQTGCTAANVTTSANPNYLILWSNVYCNPAGYSDASCTNGLQRTDQYVARVTVWGW